MSTPNKRRDNMEDSGINAKRPKSECPYAEKCFRLNPIHFREYSHAHCNTETTQNNTEDRKKEEKLKEAKQKDSLWFSPSCPELPADSMPHEGESPTMFKKSLLRYLNNYHLPNLAFYVDRVKRCNFSHINVFLVASVPGSHFDLDWGMTRVGSLLRQHCCIPPEETKNWPLIAQASSIGSYGKEPKLWLTGDFLHNFTKIKNQSQLLSTPPELKIVYPSLENVRQSHDNLLGGGCLPYAGDAHAKQPWLNSFL
ncbi:hypothetical protein HF086_005812 [Spodoptera exigua]|uniref:PBZ-type domain-containing protein n=1 Tax=Spodoptera exigua TaxID=7107 RepID=A0A922M8D6_SPOEX|nr:hypothetical protein HF086_005812 [Spodoptera exigua]